MTVTLKRVISPDHRAMRSNTTQPNKWARLGIACALLLPPLTLGAAFYSMLANPDGGAAHPADAASGAQAARPESPGNTMQPRALGPDPQPFAQATQPVAVAGEPALFESRFSAPATGARLPPAGSSAEEAARASDQVRTKVANVPPTGVKPAPGDGEAAPTGAPGAEPPRSAAEVSAALPPPALIPPGRVPLQMPPTRANTQRYAAHVPPADDLHSADGPAAPSSIVGRHGRSATLAGRRHVRPPRQHAFSWKNWFQQLGILPRNTRS